MAKSVRDEMTLMVIGSFVSHQLVRVGLTRHNDRASFQQVAIFRFHIKCTRTNARLWRITEMGISP